MAVLLHVDHLPVRLAGMFEKPNSLSGPGGMRIDRAGGYPAGFDVSQIQQDAGDQPEAIRAGGALRAIEWGELTARLLAARDFRQVLRRDTKRTIGDSAHDFADAAARYFRTKDEGQANLNPVALEHRKGSASNGQIHIGPRARGVLPQERLNNGDARDD